MTLLVDQILNDDEINLLLACIDSSVGSNDEKQQIVDAYLMLKGE